MAERKQKVSIPLTVLSVLIAVIVVFPIVWMVLSSFKPSGELFSYPLHLFSQDPTVEHYASVLAGGFMGYVKNSLFLAVVGTLITLVISSMCGYALAIYRFEIKYVNLVFGVFLLGTLIPGETLTVPQFSVISALGLYNNIWAVILPGSLSIWNIILARTYFTSIPDTIRESAAIDGASHFTILLRIYTPLAKPILAVISIYTIVITWNSWFNALVYLPDTALQPLQLYLRRVLLENTVDLTKLPMNEVAEAVRRSLSNVQLKYAMIIFTTLPVLFAYPFFQKHFVKGIMVGSLKG